MSASNEWTEWHLTPRGWEPGTEKTDFSRIDREPPLDRVLTIRWREYLGHHYGIATHFHEEIWRSIENDLVNNLLAKFDSMPQSL